MGWFWLNVRRYYATALVTMLALVAAALADWLLTSRSGAVPVGPVLFYGFLIATLLLPLALGVLAVLGVVARYVGSEGVRPAAGVLSLACAAASAFESGEWLVPIGLGFAAATYFGAVATLPVVRRRAGSDQVPPS